MGLILTPDSLRAAYEYLRTTKPFNKWHLPPAEAVEMIVSRKTDIRGEYQKKQKQHKIFISDHAVGATDVVMRTMAHEMIHMAQNINKTETGNTIHNKDFYRRIALVAKHHCFDPKWF